MDFIAKAKPAPFQVPSLVFVPRCKHPHPGSNSSLHQQSQAKEKGTVLFPIFPAVAVGTVAMDLPCYLRPGKWERLSCPSARLLYLGVGRFSFVRSFSVQKGPLPLTKFSVLHLTPFPVIVPTTLNLTAASLSELMQLPGQDELVCL